MWSALSVPLDDDPVIAGKSMTDINSLGNQSWRVLVEDRCTGINLKLQ